MPASPPLERLVVVAVAAAALAAADLSVKATIATDAAHFHDRSLTWAVASYGLLLVALALAALPSRTVALGAGVLAGGVAGNLLSAAWHGGRVPNPLVLGDGAQVIAFNVADVFVLAGNAVLVVSLAALAIRHRRRLLPPRAWERAARRSVRRAVGRGRTR